MRRPRVGPSWKALDGEVAHHHLASPFALLDALAGGLLRAPAPARAHHSGAGEPPLPQVVFVTAFDQHAVRAFEVNALDYLLKPVDPSRPAATVARVQHARRVGPRGSGSPEVAPAHSARALAYDDQLFVEIAPRPQFVAVRDVVGVLAQDDYTALLLRDGRQPLVAAPMHRWEARLPPQHFGRVHRSVIVQFAAITRVDTCQNGTYRVHVAGCARPLPMSRRYAAYLHARLR